MKKSLQLIKNKQFLAPALASLDLHHQKARTYITYMANMPIYIARKISEHRFYHPDQHESYAFELEAGGHSCLDFHNSLDEKDHTAIVKLHFRLLEPHIFRVTDQDVYGSKSAAIINYIFEVNHKEEIRHFCSINASVTLAGCLDRECSYQNMPSHEIHEYCNTAEKFVSNFPATTWMMTAFRQQWDPCCSISTAVGDLMDLILTSEHILSDLVTYQYAAERLSSPIVNFNPHAHSRTCRYFQEITVIPDIIGLEQEGAVE